MNIKYYTGEPYTRFIYDYESGVMRVTLIYPNGFVRSFRYA